MKRLWSAQARQMVNMASLAADMLSSSEVFEQLGVSDDGTESFVLSPHDMYRMIGNTVERDEGVGGGIPFMLELQIIAKEGGWGERRGQLGRARGRHERWRVASVSNRSLRDRAAAPICQRPRCRLGLHPKPARTRLEGLEEGGRWEGGQRRPRDRSDRAYRECQEYHWPNPTLV